MPTKTVNGVTYSRPGVSDLNNPDGISIWKFNNLDEVVEIIDAALYAARGGHDEAFAHVEHLKGALIGNLITAIELVAPELEVRRKDAPTL